MKFLADENIPSHVIRFLMELGHEVVTVESLGKQQTSDNNLITLARKYNLIIVTLDLDFAYLYHFSKEKFNAIILRFKPLYIDRVKSMLNEVLLRQKEVKGLVIISEKQVKTIK